MRTVSECSLSTKGSGRGSTGAGIGGGTNFLGRAVGGGGEFVWGPSSGSGVIGAASAFIKAQPGAWDGAGYSRSSVDSPGRSDARVCQAEAPCALCVWCREPCEFKVLVEGSCWDSSVVCIAAEQGWEQAWVMEQLREGQRARVLEGRVPSGKAGPPWGGCREKVPTMQDKGKQRASPPKVRPSKRPQAQVMMAGSPGPHVYSPGSGAVVGWSGETSGPSSSISETFLCQQVEALTGMLVTRKEELRRIGEDRDAMQRDHYTELMYYFLISGLG
ncbi:hypothetical protein E4T56_gene633 [Termitomyces sp. T112]|nr:hypothetical protein E4T56_gene633 [Termitomyces sp. T112]